MTIFINIPGADGMTFGFNDEYARELIAAKDGYKHPALVGILPSLAPWALKQGWLTQTDATEHLYGTSGRGSPQAKHILAWLAQQNILAAIKKGRVIRYYAPAPIHRLCEAAPGFDREAFNREVDWIEDGTRPAPKPHDFGRIGRSMGSFPKVRL